jgi:hypothetical protein
MLHLDIHPGGECVTLNNGACLFCLLCRYIPAEEDLVVGLIKDKRGGEVGTVLDTTLASD